MLASSKSHVPFRWDLVTPGRLGSMFADLPELDPEFWNALVDAGDKALTRSVGGLIFVGRSLDSMLDRGTVPGVPSARRPRAAGLS